MNGFKPRKEKHSSNWTIGIIILVVAGLALMAFLLWDGQPTMLNTHSKPTPTPSPGQPGNLGDQAKSQIGQRGGTPTPTALAQSITIDQFAPEPRSGGQVHVSSIVSRVTSGECTLKLASPAGSTSSFSGQISWSGTYYFCSFGSITGVNQAGVWHATLTATSNGRSPGSSTTTFNVTGS